MKYINVVEGSFSILTAGSDYDQLITAGYSSCMIHVIYLEKGIALFHDNSGAHVNHVQVTVKELPDYFGLLKKVVIVNRSERNNGADGRKWIKMNHERALEIYDDLPVDIEFVETDDDFLAVSKVGEIVNDNEELGISTEHLEGTELDCIRYMINKVNYLVSKYVRMDLQFDGRLYHKPQEFLTNRREVERVINTDRGRQMLEFPALFTRVINSPETETLFKFN